MNYNKVAANKRVNKTVANEVEEPEKEVEAPTLFKVNVKLLNLRKYPDLSSDILDVLREGDEVVRMDFEEYDEFYKVGTNHGDTGFCVSKYLDAE